jgi:hypothetical protein
MPKQNVSMLLFNRGVISPLALGRIDQERVNFSAETQTNFVPRMLGSMRLRCGTKYIGTTYQNKYAKHIPFIFTLSDTAILEFTDNLLRVKVNEQPILRETVTTAIANGNFDTNLASWTNNDEGTATSVWQTGGYAKLTGTGTDAAILEQQVTVSGGNLNKEHAVRILIEQGNITFKIGSTSGGDDYITETTLSKGEHSLAFTPAGNVYIEFLNRSKRSALINSIRIESNEELQIATLYNEDDLK